MIYRRTYSKAFTIVELLVVLSIIAMLSSVVLVAVQGARDKGQVGAGVRFAGYNYHAFGADAIIYSDFNTGSLVNLSPYNFVATPGTVGTIASGDTPNNGGQAYILPGLGGVSDTGAQFALASQMPDNTFSSYTVSMWVKPDAASADGWVFYSDITTGCSDSNNRLASLYWYAATGGVQVAIYNGGVGGNQWSDGNTYVPKAKWTHVAYTYNSVSNTHSFFVNGKKLTGTMLTGATGVSKRVSCVRLGYNNTAGTQTFKGGIDEVAVYTQSLAANDIEKIYAAGLPTHTLVDAQ